MGARFYAAGLAFVTLRIGLLPKSAPFMTAGKQSIAIIRMSYLQ